MGIPTPPSTQASTGLSYDAFLALLRSDTKALDAYFGELGASVMLPSTQATVHCRYLKLDGNGNPRASDLAFRLANEVVNYSIPRSEIVRAKAKEHGPHDTRHLVALHRKAVNLFTDLKKSGEGGELLLYLLAETYLGLPQLFCKMPLKTSSSMHYHGTDGLHGAFDPGTNSLALYWGESKLHATPAKAISECLESLAPYVLPAGGSSAPQSRDLQLLSDNLDLNDADLEEAILRYLDPDDPAYSKLVYRGIGLVGFDSDSYAPGKSPLTEADLSTALSSSTASWNTSFAFHVNKQKLKDVSIELFCIPFPSVQQFRDAMLAELGIS